MKLQTLKEKGRNLMLAPAVALATTPAFAGDLADAVNAGKDAITGSKVDIVTAFGAIIALAVVIWIGRKVAGLFGGGR